MKPYLACCTVWVSDKVGIMHLLTSELNKDNLLGSRCLLQSGFNLTVSQNLILFSSQTPLTVVLYTFLDFLISLLLFIAFILS